MKPRQRTLLIGLGAMLALLLLLAALGYGVTLWRFHRATPAAPWPQPQFWSHHGLTRPGVEKNSLASLEAAVQAGARGVELDIEYDFSAQEFRLLGFPTSLHEVFNRLAPLRPDLQYWLDYKPMDAGNPALLAAKLRDLVQQQGLMEQVWVESWHKKALVHYKQVGFRTLYWAVIHAEPGTWDAFVEWHRLRAYLAAHGHDGVSGDVDAWDAAQRQQLGAWPLFLFTVNRNQELKQIKDHPPLQVILTDRADWLAQGQLTP